MSGKCFCWAFKLGFLQLIYSASLIPKSDLESASSVTSKQRELYESKHVSTHIILFVLKSLIKLTLNLT